MSKKVINIYTCDLCGELRLARENAFSTICLTARAISERNSATRAKQRIEANDSELRKIVATLYYCSTCDIPCENCMFHDGKCNALEHLRSIGIEV